MRGRKTFSSYLQPLNKHLFFSLYIDLSYVSMRKEILWIFYELKNFDGNEDIKFQFQPFRKHYSFYFNTSSNCIEKSKFLQQIVLLSRFFFFCMKDIIFIGLINQSKITALNIFYEKSFNCACLNIYLPFLD